MAQTYIPAIKLGGKGFSLSSSLVHSAATRKSKISIDPYSFGNLTCSVPQTVPRVTFPVTNQTLTTAESRASLTLLLSKLVCAPNSSEYHNSISVITKILNSSSDQESDIISVTESELVAVKKCWKGASIYGIWALVDHETALLCTLVDSVAAMSCEAIRANSSAFNIVDSGDGLCPKEEVAVASDFRVLFGGSNLVGKTGNSCECILKIPRIHGCLREASKNVHSKFRTQANSWIKSSESDADEFFVRTTLLPLLLVLFDIGKSSMGRTELNLNSIPSQTVKTKLDDDFHHKCESSESLRKEFKLILDMADKEDSVNLVHKVHLFLSMVWRALSWEATVAFMCIKLILKELEHAEKNEAVSEAKGSKKKKKKVVCGKGTSTVLHMIDDMLRDCVGDTEDLNCTEKFVRGFSLIFDANNPRLETLVARIKEIIDSNEARRIPKRPKGTWDFANKQMAIRRKIFSIVEDVFERHGATALDTPTFELRETLTGKYGEDSKLIYDLSDQGGELCSLRYDLTVPFARYVASNGLTSFKRYQIAKVYRRDNPAKGRSREFYQCDFDIAGQHEKMGPDFEVIKLLTELLDELDIGEYEIKINHRKLLDGMLVICGVPPFKFRAICSSIDKLDKLSFQQIRNEMVNEKGLSPDAAEKIGTFVQRRGLPMDLLFELKREGSEFTKHESSSESLNELELLFKALEKSRCVHKIVFDLSLARGLDYYTGVIFEAVLKGGPQFGSIAAGGRYDNLIGMFGSKHVPAVGVSLGIERVFAIMEQRRDMEHGVRATKTEVLIGVLVEDIVLAAELVSELWDAKIKADYSINKRVMKHIDRAKCDGTPFLVLIGTDELESRVVTIKEIATAKEEKLPRDMLVEELRRRLNITV